jgi:8-oxo-dGTP pyrophosphatase MutT (NUDIX family)
MSAGDRAITSRSYSDKFFRPSQLRKLRGCEQVAAVCYRIGGRGVEFLLVQTRSGRWTFPKGGVEPGLTHAQTAALEAFEEAGVHGRMEEESFAQYTRRKRSGVRRSAATEIAVHHAHLCEVSRLGPPQEPGRNPTWFSSEKAKRRLQEDRTPDDGTEFARVVDCAVARIRRLRQPTCAAGDALQKVQFEALPEPGAYARVEEALFARFIRQHGDLPPTAIGLAVNAQLGRVLQLQPPTNRRLLEERTPDYPAECARLAEAKPSGTGKKNRR